MLHSTRGIVLKTVKYSENSIIARIFTEDFGLRPYIVKGVTGKAGHRKKALLQGLTLLNLVVYEKPTTNLQHIREMESATAFGSIPFDIRKSTIVMFLNEVLHKSLVEEVANPEMFNFIFNEIAKLDSLRDGVPEFHLRFLIKLTWYLGFFPRDNFSEQNRFFDLQEGVFINGKPLHSNFMNEPAARQFSRALRDEPEILCNRSSERNELLEKIILYYGLQVPNFGELKSYAVLKQVLNS